MTLARKSYWIAALVSLFIFAGAYATYATVWADSGNGGGGLSEGADLLDQATISVQDAIAAAQGVADGDVKEVELEMENGTLIFEVEIGGKEVIVDASDGSVLGTEQEDGESDDEGEDHDDSEDEDGGADGD